MKNSFKKIALLCTALAMNVSAYAISTGGAVAAGFGTAAAVGLLAYGISKSHKKDKKKHVEKSGNSHSFKQEKKVTKKSSLHSEKKQLKEDINMNKKELRRHKLELKKLEKKGKGSTPEAADHKSMIRKFENTGKELKEKLQSL